MYQTIDQPSLSNHTSIVFCGEVVGVSTGYGAEQLDGHDTRNYYSERVIGKPLLVKEKTII